MKPKSSQSVLLKKRFLDAREKYLKKLKTISEQKGKRNIHNTAMVLEGLNLQHRFMQSEIKRLERTIELLKSRGKKVDPRFSRRLTKLKKEDGENQSRAKSIKEYFKTELEK